MTLLTCISNFFYKHSNCREMGERRLVSAYQNLGFYYFRAVRLLGLSGVKKQEQNGPEQTGDEPSI